MPSSGEQFANLGGKGFDPSEYTNLEAGVKWDFTSGYSVTAAIFQGNQDVVEKIDKVWVRIDREVTGFEAQFNGQLTDQWSLTAGYSYITGEIEDHSKADLVGNDPREIPEQMLSIWNHYQLTEKLGLGLGATYHDSSYINDSNSAELPSFFRVDAAAYYQVSENLRLQVNIENLLDEDYYPSAHSTHQATVGAPLTRKLLAQRTLLVSFHNTCFVCRSRSESSVAFFVFTLHIIFQRAVDPPTHSRMSICMESIKADMILESSHWAEQQRAPWQKSAELTGLCLIILTKQKNCDHS